MNKFFLLFMLTISFFPIQVSATEQKSKIEHCKSLVGGGMYNQLLETACGFDGGVASKILYLYRTGECPNLLSEEVTNELSKLVLTDTKKRYQEMGESAFCSGNVDAYNALKKDL